MAAEVTIGLDLGGTKVAGVRLDGMRIAARATQPTAKESPEALLAQLAGIALELGAADGTAVGAGIPSAVQWPSGRVIGDSVNVPLPAGLEVRDRLADLLGGVPVAVDNDATVAALAEAHRDDGTVVPNLVMLTLGTGVGGGIICNGRIARGATGAAGHIGHEVVVGRLDSLQPADGFPRPDSLEAIAAGPALDSLAREAAAEGAGRLAALAAEGSEPTGRELVDAAGAGDATALEALRRYAGRVALGVANAIHFLDPDEVVIGGGVSEAGDLLLGPVRDAVGELMLPGVGTGTTIRLARFGADSGAVGAALLARPRFREE